MADVANYADDATVYACQKYFFDVQRKIESESTIFFSEFIIIMLLTTDDCLQINVKGSLLRNEKTVKLLAITVDKPSFEPDLNG